MVIALIFILLTMLSHGGLAWRGSRQLLARAMAQGVVPHGPEPRTPGPLPVGLGVVAMLVPTNSIGWRVLFIALLVLAGFLSSFSSSCLCHRQLVTLQELVGQEACFEIHRG
jgi:hypothetical protein